MTFWVPVSTVGSLSEKLGAQGLGRKLQQDLTGRMQMRTLSFLLLGMRKATGHKLVIDTRLCGTQIVCIVYVGVCVLQITYQSSALQESVTLLDTVCTDAQAQGGLDEGQEA